MDFDAGLIEKQRGESAGGELFSVQGMHKW